MPIGAKEASKLMNNKKLMNNTQRAIGNQRRRTSSIPLQKIGNVEFFLTFASNEPNLPPAPVGSGFLIGFIVDS